MAAQAQDACQALSCLLQWLWNFHEARHHALGLLDCTLMLAAVYVRACTSRPDQRRFPDRADKEREELRLREAVLADLQNLQDAVAGRLVEVCCLDKDLGHGV